MKILLLLAAALSGALSSFAQDVNQKERSFTVVGYGESFFDGLKFLDEEKEEIELAFIPNRRSRTYLLPNKKGRIEFFIEAKNERRRTIRVPQAVVDIDEGISAALLIFMFEGENRRQLPYAIQVIDESPEQFGPGDYRLLNLTGVPMKAQLGDEVLDSDLGLSRMVSIPINRDGSMSIRLAVQTRDGWKIVHSTSTRPDRLYGSLLVLKPPLEEGSYRIRVERLW